MTSPSLAARVLSGDPRAVARAISLVEDDTPAGAALIQALFPHSGRAYLVGVTGPPGAGKSTLVDRLTAGLRAGGRTVGIVAVDPSSPFTGGALLGDRVRMQAHAGDPGVFIRSMATRGHLGGLSRAAADAAIVLDAAGAGVVLIETVGVGQDEVDIVRTADVSVVTLVPGAGDEVQALKAGIMEIADIFVVNKADREGADRTAAAIEAMLSLQTYGDGDWRPPILRTQATAGTGVPELLDTVERFRAHTGAARPARLRARAGFRLREILSGRFLRHVEGQVLGQQGLDALLDAIVSRTTDPYTAADGVVRAALGAAAPGCPIHHVGVAVRTLAEGRAFYLEQAGLTAEPPEEVPSQQVRVQFLRAASGGTAIELIEPAGPGAPLHRFLERRGPGLHHVAFAVPDLGAALAAAAGRGLRLIDEAPRPGAHGSLVAFLHPSAAGGVLVELVQA